MTFFVDLFWRRKKRTLISACIMMLVLFEMFFCGKLENFKGTESDGLSMYSGSYALIDADSGRVLAGKQEDNPMANASTTKILTCILALEHCQCDEMAKVSANAAAQPRVRMGVKEGEEYPLIDMLYGLMLESYNDCAVVIAEHVAGSVEDFADMMNEKATEIGCKDTYFITPNGLDAEDEMGFHHTTAQDLCRIMAYCTWESLQKDTFLEITQTQGYQTFTNHNSFLSQMEGAISGKTGFTSKAGYCYVAALERGGERFCIALLACGWPDNKNYKWHDARELFTYGMENYDKASVIVEKIQQEIEVEGYIECARFQKLNQTSMLELYADHNEYSLLMQEGESVEAKVQIDDDISLPIKKGQVLGTCDLYIDDFKIGDVPLMASENVYIWGWKENFYTIFYQFLTFSL